MKLQMKTRISAQRNSKFASRRRGQALIEMAFVSIILILLTTGIIQYGVLYNTSVQLTNATREGARYAGIHGNEDDVAAKTRDYIRTKVIVGTSIRAASLPDANITLTKAATAGKGDPITVQITYDLTQRFILPVEPLGMDKKDKRWTEHKTTATMIIE